jgi:hypothetical protein
MVDGPNLYEYVRGNPIRLRDPTGHFGMAQIYQAREYLSRASQAVDRAYDTATGAVSNAAAAAATAAAKHLLVPLVEGFAGGSSASAPTSEEEARTAPKAQTYTEQAAVLGASVLGGKLGGAVVGRVAGQLSSTTARGVVSAAGAGSTASVAGLSAHDVVTGTTSSSGDYVAAAGTGAVAGVAHHGVSKVVGAGSNAAKTGAQAFAARALPALKQVALAPAGIAIGVGPGAPLPKLPKGPSARNITVSGTMTEAEFKTSMKTEPGQYTYVMVDAKGNVLKPGVTADPFRRFNDYVTKEGMRTAQMRVYGPNAGFQARGAETAGIASEMEQGRATMNVRTETRAEMRQGREWSDVLEQPLAPSGTPLITIRRTQ